MYNNNFMISFIIMDFIMSIVLCVMLGCNLITFLVASGLSLFVFLFFKMCLKIEPPMVEW